MSRGGHCLARVSLLHSLRWCHLQIRYFELYQKSRLLWTKRPPEGIQATPVSPFKRILIKAFHLKKTDKLKE